MKPSYTDTEQLYEIFKQYPRVSTDSRRVEPNSIFFALKGESFNGNVFAEQALNQGCVFAVCDEEEFTTSDRILLVADCLRSLQDLACYHRQQLGTPLIAITGTNGKTTTKELAAAVLSTTYRVLFTQGNLNNHIGVPLTLLQLTPEHELAIVEMGANHLGEIAALSAIALPDYGLITNVGKAHLEGFGSLEGVIKTKTELYRYLKNTGGKVFVDHSNPYLPSLTEGIDQLEYGQADGLFVCGRLLGSTPYISLEWKATEGLQQTTTQLIGAYNLQNVLAAITLGVFFGVPTANINTAIAAYCPHNHRSQSLQTQTNLLLVDAYNANPTSMLAALENFAALPAAKKALILGDMKELGADSQQEHQAIVDYVSAMQVDKVYYCGTCFFEVATTGANSCFTTTQELLEYLREHPLSGYTVLIKGSRSMNLEKTLALL